MPLQILHGFSSSCIHIYRIPPNDIPDRLSVVTNDVIVIPSLPTEFAKASRTDTLGAYRLDLTNDSTQ